MLNILGNILIFCHLSLTSNIDLGTNVCSGMWSVEHEGIVTAKHCLRNSSDPNDYLIIAECGNHNWEFDEINNFKFSRNKNDDLVILKFKSEKKIKLSDEIRTLNLSKYKALYFGVDNKLLKGVKCFFINRNEKLIELSSTNSITLNLNNVIEVKPNMGTSLEPYFMDHGDSGSPLICKPNGPLSYEIVGIASTYQTMKSNPSIKVGNTYAPVFEAFNN